MYKKRKWSDILTIISGKNQKEVASEDGEYFIYGSGGIIGCANDYLCPANTVIVGRKGTIDHPLYVTEPFWNIDTAFGVVAGEELLPKFLYYFCLQFNFKELDKSTGRPSVSKSDLLKIEMPLPNIEEQARIVSRIEKLFSKLDKGVETLQIIKKQLTVYRQAVLKDEFDVLATIKTAKVCQHITDGDHMSPPKALNGIPFIMISNIENNKINWEHVNYVRNEYYEKIGDKRTPRKGDVLYTVTGSFGIPVMVDFDKSFCFQRHIALLRPNEKITQEFLYYALQSKDVYLQASKRATGTAQKTVGLGTLRDLDIPFCRDIEIQKKIVKRIEARLSICDSIEKTVDTALLQADAMRQSILKKAFEGGLN